MLTIRFQRIGRKNDPSFRIVVSEKARHPKAGKPLMVLGSYNPKTKHTLIDAEAVKGWIAKGAQASGTVHNLLLAQGIVEGKKVNVRNAKVAPKKEEEKAAEAPKVEAPAEAKAEAPAEATTEAPAAPSVAGA